ncbi:hypothetical protein GC163_11515 [bacterium]|nr:hypothetical protein [bacterium]
MSVYDPHRWTSHLFDIKGSLVKEILGRVALCVVWALLITGLHQWWGTAGKSLEIPEVAHSLIGAALGLLLVFRTNASYDRFWEGRKLWGGIVNETRNLARQASVLCAADAALVREIVLWTAAFPYACLHRLRGEKGLGPIQHDLDPATVHQIATADHVPLATAQQITRLLREAHARGLVGEYQQMQIDQNVQLLIDYIGACERIHSTPMPYAYAVHLRRALILYCFTLPFALVARFGWNTVLATLMITYILYGIEEIGVEIEDPFGTDDNDLPLEKICANIEQNLRAVLQTLPKSLT